MLGIFLQRRLSVVSVPDEKFLLTTSSFTNLQFTKYLAKMKFIIQDLLGQSDTEFEQYLENFSTKESWKPENKISICGPEYDAMGYYGHDGDEDGYNYDEPKSVPEDRLERVFKTIAILPNLREIAIDPGYYCEEGGMLSSSRVCWLLSKEAMLRL